MCLTLHDLVDGNNFYISRKRVILPHLNNGEYIPCPLGRSPYVRFWMSATPQKAAESFIDWPVVVLCGDI